MNKVRLATVWLDGCSGCHMSFLDIDEALISLSEKVDLVYSPLVDEKNFPAHDLLLSNDTERMFRYGIDVIAVRLPTKLLS